MSNSLISAMLGLDETSARSPRIPPRMFFLLALTMGTIYVSNGWSSGLTSFLTTAKWLPMGLLAVISAYLLQERKAPSYPVAMTMPLMAMFIVGMINIPRSVDVGFSALSLLTVTGTIICGYFISAMIIASDSRRAYFELLATCSRLMIVATVLFVVALGNFGRGAGLSAWSDNPNTLAAMLAPGMVVFVAGCIERRPGWQFWHGAFFVIGFYLIWATNSRASTIWVLISMCAFWLYRRGPGLTVLLTMVVMIVLIAWWVPIKEYVIEVLGLRWTIRNAGISPLSGREEVWKVGWELFQKKPLLGYGLGTSQELIAVQAYKFVRHQGLHFHSSYIMAMVELGLFGLIGLLTAIFFTLSRAVAYSGRTRILPRESWPLAALPFALIVGALGHALFESWLIAAGNANMLLFWTWIWMTHHQSQVKIRAVIRREEPMGQYPTGTALSAR